MANAINSPTAQNLSHKSIIELANITYENARAAVEAKGQADDAAEAAAASASAADNSADLADLAKMAAAASANAANADMITASNKAIAAGNSANAAADSADAAADSADAAAQSAAEVAAALSTKVDKTTNSNVVYATDDHGNPLPLKYGATHSPTSAGYGSIVYRTRSGYFNVLDATNDQHPAAYHQAKRFYASIHITTDVSGELFEYDFPRVLVDTYNTANLTTVKKISQHVISPFLGHETASGNTFHAVYVGDPDYTESICTINASGQFVPIDTNNTTTVTVTIYTY